MVLERLGMSDVFTTIGLTEKSWQQSRGTWGGPPTAEQVAQQTRRDHLERQQVIAQTIAAVTLERAQQEKVRLQIESERLAQLEAEKLAARREEVAATLAGAIAAENMVICSAHIGDELFAQQQDQLATAGAAV
jgi:hypothetical protein